MPRRTVIALALLFLPMVTYAGVRFTRLSENRFIVSHQKQTDFGRDARAIKTLYGEVASICVAAGFSHFEIVTLDVTERQGWGGRGLSVNVDVRMRNEAGEDHIECAPLADPKKVGVAKKKLAEGK